MKGILNIGFFDSLNLSFFLKITKKAYIIQRPSNDQLKTWILYLGSFGGLVTLITPLIPTGKNSFRTYPLVAITNVECTGRL